MPAATYVEPHWFTGKLKIRCEDCGKVVYDSQEEAEMRAAQISERTPMKAYRGRCENYHVARVRGRR